jgi:hypothetical protein
MIDELKSIGWIKSLYNKVSKGIHGTEFGKSNNKNETQNFIKKCLCSEFFGMGQIVLFFPEAR